MAVPTHAELKTLALQHANADAAVDAPLLDAETTRFLNDAYAAIWELAGGTAKRVTHATAWNEASDGGDGLVTGKITDIGEILHLWRSTSASSVGRTNGDIELWKVEPSRIAHLRSWGGLAVGLSTPAGQVGEYAAPCVYCAYRKDAAGVAADVNKFAAEVWPALSGTYYPIEYLPQFIPLAATTDAPDVTDLDARDIGLYAGAKIAGLLGNAHLVPGILTEMSQRGQLALERKLGAMLQARQDR